MSNFFVILIESKCFLAVSAEKCDYEIITKVSKNIKEPHRIITSRATNMATFSKTQKPKMKISLNAINSRGESKTTK